MEVVRSRLLAVEYELKKLGFTRLYRWKVPSVTPNNYYLIQVCPAGHLLVLTVSMAKQIGKVEDCYECCSASLPTQTDLNKRIDVISRYDVLLHKLIWCASLLNNNSEYLNIAFRKNKKASEAIESFVETKGILDELTDADETDEDVHIEKDLTLVNGNYAMLIHKLSAEVDKLRLQLQLQKLDQVLKS